MRRDPVFCEGDQIFEKWAAETAGIEEKTFIRRYGIEDAVAALADNLKVLTQLEQKHIETREAVGRAFDAIGDQDKRIRDIELEMPLLKMVRNWVVAGVVGIVTLVGIALVSLVVITTRPVPQAPAKVTKLTAVQVNIHHGQEG